MVFRAFPLICEKEALCSSIGILEITAITQISQYGHQMNKTNHAVVIFPEGTRSNSAHLSPFKMGGLKALIDAMPDALIVPFVVHNNYQIFENGNFPLKLGNHLRYSILDPFSSRGPRCRQLERYT